MELSDVPKLPRGVRIHHDKVRDAWVLLAPERAITLDPVGQAILEKVDGTRSFDDITKALAEKYNAPAQQIREDSAGFLTALKNRRFLDIAE
ncbi:MAG: pyrroloquinoline quinone biosynthesis peptide chaperone PqqD [Pseudomonadota bacterium]